MSHFCSTALVFLRSSCKAFFIPGRSFFTLDMARSSRYWLTRAIVRLEGGRGREEGEGEGEGEGKDEVRCLPNVAMYLPFSGHLFLKTK